MMVSVHYYDPWDYCGIEDLKTILWGEYGDNLIEVNGFPKMNKAKLPTHIEICTNDYNIMKNSVILLEQIRTIDKKRLREYVCHIDQERMKKIDQAIRISLDLTT